MNKHIKNLFDQATTLEARSWPRQPKELFDKEFFATLLLQECIQVLKDTGYPNIYGNCVGVEEIKQHFEIKDA
jgi:hypothetical protein